MLSETVNNIIMNHRCSRIHGGSKFLGGFSEAQIGYCTKIPERQRFMSICCSQL